MKKNFKKIPLEGKLAGYSAMVIGLTTLPLLANSQILYYDITPDTLCGDTSTFEIDLNLDMVNDVQLYQGTNFGNGIKTIALHVLKGAEVFGSVNGVYFYPFKLNPGDTIKDDPSNWNKHDIGTLNYEGNLIAGNWLGDVKDGYLGIRVTFNSQLYYGWARLDVRQAADTFMVKDYAFETRPGTQILAGQGVAVHNVKNLVVKDIADNGNPSDLQVSFTRAKNEDMVSEYRLFMVDYQNTDSFTVAKAKSLNSSRYVQIAKTGSDQTLTLPSNLKDSEGRTPKLGRPYQVFILSVKDGVLAKEDMLSTSSRAFTLINIFAEPVTNIAASDIGNNGNGSDIQVSFSKAIDENKVAEYRVYVVKSSKAGSFNLATAGSMPADRFVKVSKTGSDLQVNLIASLRDSDGDVINNTVPYKVFVVTMADGIYANVHALSQPSNELILQNTGNIPGNEAVSPFEIILDANSLLISSETGFAEIKVIDYIGKEVYFCKERNQFKEIDVNMWPSGIYIVSVTTESGNLFQHKILINR